MLPVFFSQASTPSLQVSNSLPTEPHEIAISTDSAGAAPDPAGFAEPCAALPDPLSASFFVVFLHPPANNTVAQSTAAAHAFIECPFPEGACDLTAGELTTEQIVSLVSYP